MITCSFCGVNVSIRQFQTHLKLRCKHVPQHTAEETICTFCQQPKNLTEFTYNKSLSIKEYCCDSCRIAKSQEWYAQPENRERRRFVIAKKKYGILPDEYRSLIDTQHGLCAICGQKPSGRAAKTSMLHVDHDHTTGAVRALLCYRCNHGIGSFRDDAALLAKAIAYLNSYRDVAVSDH